MNPYSHLIASAMLYLCLIAAIAGLGMILHELLSL